MLVSGTNIKTINDTSILGSGNIVIPKGDKGDPLTYADLTAAQKAELAQPAAEQAAIAAQHLATIQDAIDGLDPSTSTEDAIVALTAQVASTNVEVDDLKTDIEGLVNPHGFIRYETLTLTFNNNQLAYNSTNLNLEVGKTYKISVSTTATIESGKFYFFLRKVASQNTPNIAIADNDGTRGYLDSSTSSSSMVFTVTTDEYQYLASWHSDDVKVSLSINAVIEEQVSLPTATERLEEVENNSVIQTMSLFENSNNADWFQGNINNGNVVTTTSNKLLRIGIPEGVSTLRLERRRIDSRYYARVYLSKNESSGYNTFTNIFSDGTYNIEVTGFSYLIILVWDAPSINVVRAEGISIYYTKHVKAVVSSNYFDNDPTHIASMELISQMAKALYIDELTAENGGIVWEQGGINGGTGFEEVNSRAIRTKPIYLNGDSNALAFRGYIANFNGAIAVYNEKGAFQLFSSAISLVPSYPKGYVRFVFYGGSDISPTAGDSCKAFLIRRKNLKERVTATEDVISKPYFNPVLRADYPDPTVWDGEDGYFYIFATGNISNQKMYRSANLIDWENTQDSPYTSSVADEIVSAFSNTSFWAPCVYKVNGNQWNMYLSAPSGTRIAVLTSSKPTSGYHFVRTLTAPFSDFIDAEVAMGRDGNLYMFAGAAQKMFRCQLTQDGLNTAEGSEWVHVAGLATDASGNTGRVKTFEGAYLYRRQGYWYLFCSSGSYATSSYSLRVVRSETIDGTFTDKEGNLATDGYAEYVLKSNGTLFGPGHNAQIFVDIDNRTWILYHAHWSGFSSSGYRGVCIDELLWDENGWPYVGGGTPTTENRSSRGFRR